MLLLKVMLRRVKSVRDVTAKIVVHVAIVLSVRAAIVMTSVQRVPVAMMMIVQRVQAVTVMTVIAQRVRAVIVMMQIALRVHVVTVMASVRHAVVRRLCQWLSSRTLRLRLRPVSLSRSTV